jgi:hypothetical protein
MSRRITVEQRQLGEFLHLLHENNEIVSQAYARFYQRVAAQPLSTRMIAAVPLGGRWITKPDGTRVEVESDDDDDDDDTPVPESPTKRRRLVNSTASALAIVQTASTQATPELMDDLIEMIYKFFLDQANENDSRLNVILTIGRVSTGWRAWLVRFYPSEIMNLTFYRNWPWDRILMNIAELGKPELLADSGFSHAQLLAATDSVSVVYHELEAMQWFAQNQVKLREVVEVAMPSTTPQGKYLGLLTSVLDPRQRELFHNVVASKTFLGTFCTHECSLDYTGRSACVLEEFFYHPDATSFMHALRDAVLRSDIHGVKRLLVLLQKPLPAQRVGKVYEFIKVIRDEDDPQIKHLCLQLCDTIGADNDTEVQRLFDELIEVIPTDLYPHLMGLMLCVLNADAVHRTLFELLMVISPDSNMDAHLVTTFGPPPPGAVMTLPPSCVGALAIGCFPLEDIPEETRDRYIDRWIDFSRERLWFVTGFSYWLGRFTNDTPLAKRFLDKCRMDQFSLISFLMGIAWNTTYSPERFAWIFAEHVVPFFDEIEDDQSDEGAHLRTRFYRALFHQQIHPDRAFLIQQVWGFQFRANVFLDNLVDNINSIFHLVYDRIFYASWEQTVIPALEDERHQRPVGREAQEFEESITAMPTLFHFNLLLFYKTLRQVFVEWRLRYLPDFRSNEARELLQEVFRRMGPTPL